MDLKYYHSNRGLWPFQSEIVAQAYLQPVTLCVADTGLGKSHIAMALASLLFEDDEIDHVLLVAEKNKLSQSEWPSDLEKFTSFSWADYSVSPAKRAKIREALPQLLLASFDIIKNDCAIFPRTSSGKKTRGNPKPGPLLDALEGRRVLVVYDEISRIANRGSDTYKAHKLLVDSLRAQPGFRCIALTATPNDRDTSSSFNLGRILIPGRMPTITEFERDYVSKWDLFRNPAGYKNLSRKVGLEEGIVPFSERFSGTLIRKRKSDPDVIDFFPRQYFVPPTFVDLTEDQEEFYEAVREIAQEVVGPFEELQYLTVLRMIAGHPASLLAAEGKIAQEIVHQVSPEGIRNIPSAKTQKMIDWCNSVVKGQGDQAIIFTFFADTVMPLLEQTLIDSGYTVSVNSGKLSSAQRSEVQRQFRAGETQIFLSSNAGSKGINLPEATYMLHYEVPASHTIYEQRSARFHRIDSQNDSVFVYSLVAKQTIEEAFYQMNIGRQQQHERIVGDDLIEDDNMITSADRRKMFRIGRATQWQPAFQPS